MSAGVYLEISRAEAIAGQPLQINICSEGENGYGHGYRIHGPKYGSSGSVTLVKHRLTEEDARQIASYLAAVSVEEEQRNG